MPGKVGFRIAADWPRPSAELLAAFADAAPAQVADVMHRFGAMDTGIRPVWSSPKIVGAAVTVQVRSADNLMIHRSLAEARPGEIVVIATQGNVTNSGFGELTGTTAAEAGLAGAIVDGVVRDGDSFEELGLPVYARGLNPNGCDKHGPGEIGYPIACGGVVVRSGDIIIADCDGVTVVPLADAEAVAEGVPAAIERETKRVKAIRDGELHKAEIDETLRAAKVIE